MYFPREHYKIDFKFCAETPLQEITFLKRKGAMGPDTPWPFIRESGSVILNFGLI